MSYTPLSFDSFGGMATRWTPEKLPPGFASVAKNVDFVGGVVRSRAGLSTAFSGPTSTARVTGLGQFSLVDGTKLVTALDSAGHFFYENPAGSGAVVDFLATGYASQYMQGEAAQGKWFFATSDLQTGSIVPKVFHKYVTDGQFYLDSVGLAANASPCAAGTSSVDSGDVDTGTRYCAVMFKTRTGYVGGFTIDAVIAITVTESNKKLVISGIPLGPSNCVARVLAFTQAGSPSAGPYFRLLTTESPIEFNAPVTATIVNNNSETSVTLNFNDDYLVAGDDVTQFFNKTSLAAQVDVYFSKTLRRLIWVGEDQKTYRVSQADDLETYYSTDGFIQPAADDGQKAITAREFRSELYLWKERTGHLVVDSTTEPSTWKTIPKIEGIGPMGPRAIDVKDDAKDGMMVVADESGAYAWNGVTMNWLSWEISGAKDNGELSWDRINRTYKHLVWVRIDTVSKKIYFGVPLDSSTAVNRVFVMDYQDGLTPGKRKWSINDWAFTSIARLQRTLPSNANVNEDMDNLVKTSQLCGASAGPDGLVSYLDPSSSTDNGKPVVGEYETRFEPSPTYGAIYQLGSVDFTVKGQGIFSAWALPRQGAAKQLREVGLEAVPTDHSIRSSGQSERWAFKFSAQGWFELSRVVAYVNKIWQRRTI